MLRSFRFAATALAASLIGVSGAALSASDNPAQLGNGVQTDNAATSDTGTTAPSAPPAGASGASTSTATPSSPATGSRPESPSGTPPADASKSDARRVFDQLDTNHDGTLTFDEFARATIQPK